ncbi:MAG: hypothetical protein R3A47_06375 [Polyangiales bacterium]
MTKIANRTTQDFDQAIADAAVEYVRIGLSINESAELAGIPIEGLEAWIRNGGDDADSDYAVFMKRARDAERETVENALRVVVNAKGKARPKAHRWILRRYGKAEGARLIERFLDD